MAVTAMEHDAAQTASATAAASSMSSRRLLSRFTLLFAACVGVLAAIAILGEVVVGRQIAAMGTDAETINSSGKRRLITARSAFLAGQLAVASDPEQRADLSRRIRLDAAELGDLDETVRRATLALTGAWGTDRAILTQLTAGAANSEIQAYIDALSSLEALPDPKSVEGVALLDHARTLSKALVDQFDAETAVWQALAERRQSGLHVLQRAALGVFLATLLGLGLFVFRPMLARLRCGIRDLAELNTALDLKVAERTRTVELRTIQFHDSERRIRGILDSVADAVVTIDERGRIQSFNPSAERMFGYIAADVIGRNVGILIPEPDRSRHDGYLRRYREGGEARIIGKQGRELTAVRADGTTFPIELTVGETRIGERPVFVGAIRDISERKWIADALASQSLELHRRVRETRCLYSVARAVARDGMSLGERLQRAVEEISGDWPHAAEPASVRLTIERDVYVSQRFAESPYRLAAAIVVDGRSIGSLEVHYTGERMPPREDKFLRQEPELLGEIARQIGGAVEREMADQALRLSRAQLETAQRIARLGSWDWDPGSGRLSCSEEALRVLGIDGSIGPPDLRQVKAAVHPEDWIPLVRATLGAMRSRRVFAIDVRIGGTEGPVSEVHFQGEADAGRAALPRMSGTVQDVSEQRRTQRNLDAAKSQAERASHAKSEFLANMSHELRTPMNAIIGFSEIMRDEMFGPLGSDVYRGYSRDIYDSGHHLLAIINDILDLARIEARRLEVEDQVFEPEAVLDASMRMVVERARSKRLTLASRIEGRETRLWADQRMMKQILLNLLSNAVKFTPPGGRIDVVAGRVADGGYAVSITDTGVGMSAEQIPQALSPFVRIESSLSRSHEGAGLGLPLTKSLVELHGGRLVIVSEPGKGTKVTVWLPPQRALDCAAA